MNINGSNIVVFGNTNIAGVTAMNIPSVTDSTSTTTGAFVTAGGIGVAKRVTAGGGYGSTTGTFTLSTTASNVYSLINGSRGFITLTTTNGNSSAMAFFEWTGGVTNASVFKLTN